MICKICGSKVKKLGTHVLTTHGIEPKEYYDRYLKKEYEGICPICGKQTTFLGITKGYRKFCSQKCSANSESTRNKYKQTCLNKYGVENVYQSKEIKDKIKTTNLERYGVPYAFQIEEVQEKSRSPETIQKRKNTLLKKYGIDNSLKSLEIQKKAHKKAKQTKLHRYGNENYNNSEQMIRTKKEKYGEYYVNTEKRKQTCLSKYGVDHQLKSDSIKEKIKNTNLEKYESEYYFGSNSHKNFLEQHKYEIIEKGNATKKKNGTLNSSKIEDTVYDILIQKFGKNNIERNYKSDKYPFNCDFYIKPLNLYVECNFHWTHGFHWFDKNNPNDIEMLNIWKEKAKKSKFYKNAINTWIVRDIEKRNKAKENKLKYIVLWTNEDINKWCSLNYPIGYDWDIEYSWKE